MLVLFVSIKALLKWWKILFISCYRAGVKYLHLMRLIVKTLYHKRYQTYAFYLHSLHKIHWRHFQVYFINLSNDIALLSQFLMRHIEETDRSLTAFLAGDARYMILTKQLFLRRSLFVHQYYFSYNWLCRNVFFTTVHKLSFQILLSCVDNL